MKKKFTLLPTPHISSFFYECICEKERPTPKIQGLIKSRSAYIFTVEILRFSNYFSTPGKKWRKIFKKFDKFKNNFSTNQSQNSTLNTLGCLQVPASVCFFQNVLECTTGFCSFGKVRFSAGLARSLVVFSGQKRFPDIPSF